MDEKTIPENIEVPEYAKQAISDLKKTEQESLAHHQAEQEKNEESELSPEETKEKYSAAFDNALEIQRLMNYNRDGFRAIGHRKQHLIRTFDKELAKLHKRGVNTKYLVKKYFGIKNVKSLTTKQWTGMVSKIKQFAKENA